MSNFDPIPSFWEENQEQTISLILLVFFEIPTQAMRGWSWKALPQFVGTKQVLGREEQLPSWLGEGDCRQHLVPASATSSRSLLPLCSECLTQHTVSPRVAPSWWMAVCPCAVLMTPPCDCHEKADTRTREAMKHLGPSDKAGGNGDSFHARMQLGSFLTS